MSQILSRSYPYVIYGVRFPIGCVFEFDLVNVCNIIIISNIYTIYITASRTHSLVQQL